MPDFIKGREYWLADGNACYLNAKTEDGSYVVELLMENMTYDGSEWIPGPMMIVNELFHKAPIAKKSGDLVAINNKITEAHARLRSIEQEIRNKDTERKALFAKLDQIPALRRLTEFVDGKATHVVIVKNYSIEIKTFEEVFEYKDRGDYRKQYKLLTLYGGSGGDLSWRISQYSDGSGYSNEDIRVFASLEAANAYASEVYKGLEDGVLIDIDKNQSIAGTMIALANKHGIKANPLLFTINEKYIADKHARDVEQARAKLAMAEQMLRNIESGVDIVLDGSPKKAAFR